MSELLSVLSALFADLVFFRVAGTFCFLLLRGVAAAVRLVAVEGCFPPAFFFGVLRLLADKSSSVSTSLVSHRCRVFGSFCFCFLAGGTRKEFLLFYID